MHAIGKTKVAALGVLGLVGVACAHLLEAPEKLDKAPSQAVLFVLLSVACLALAVPLRKAPSRRAWAGALVLAIVPLVGYVVSRSTGLPDAHSDVGKWLEPLGVASLVIEAPLAALAAWQ